MGLSGQHRTTENVATPWGELPPRMRLLFVTGPQRTGGWLAEAIASDSASQVHLEQASGMTEGMTRLRDDPFDAVLVSHEPGELDAFDFLEGMRAGSNREQPVLVLGSQDEQTMTALCFEVGADAYIDVRNATVRTLLWQMARAIQWHQLVTENRRLLQERQHRLQQEHDEASRLLTQQRALIADLERIYDTDQEKEVVAESETPSTTESDQTLHLPEQLISYYRELLRAYVVMGTGNLSNEMDRLSQMLTEAEATTQQTMRLHLHVLEEMIEGLGTRSARHIMNRADLLILEVMITLAEGYRARYQQHNDPAP